ncbi:hypothetical protein SDC9_160842 [bioreactor metagenome]|uniref:Uncharacterized protein n=1 Tax=bioreactor metagenome TaxID=1076179 RepID=A0A645FGM2_9ZZZZ
MPTVVQIGQFVEAGQAFEFLLVVLDLRDVGGNPADAGDFAGRVAGRKFDRQEAGFTSRVDQGFLGFDGAAGGHDFLVDLAVGFGHGGREYVGIGLAERLGARQAGDLLVHAIDQQVAAFTILDVGGGRAVLDHIGQEVSAFGELATQGLLDREVAHHADEETVVRRFGLGNAQMHRKGFAVFA